MLSGINNILTLPKGSLQCLSLTSRWQTHRCVQHLQIGGKPGRYWVFSEGFSTALVKNKQELYTSAWCKKPCRNVRSLRKYSCCGRSCHGVDHPPPTCPTQDFFRMPDRLFLGHGGKRIQNHKFRSIAKYKVRKGISFFPWKNRWSQ